MSTETVGRVQPFHFYGDHHFIFMATIIRSRVSFFFGWTDQTEAATFDATSRASKSAKYHKHTATLSGIDLSLVDQRG